jgi:hypothetical protein
VKNYLEKGHMLKALNLAQKHKLTRKEKPFYLQREKCTEWDKTTNYTNG